VDVMLHASDVQGMQHNIHRSQQRLPTAPNLPSQKPETILWHTFLIHLFLYLTIIHHRSSHRT